MRAGNRKLLVLSSITFAYKARDYLARQGIRCYIERIPKQLRTSGCGYGIKVEGDAQQIAAQVNQANIRVKEILDIE